MDVTTVKLAKARQTLDRRYDDLESGKVKPVPGDEVIARLRGKSAACRASHNESIPLCMDAAARA